MELKELRTEIDKIDDQIVKLFEERMEVSEKVAEYKKDSGKPVYDPQREREKLCAIAEKLPEDMQGYAYSLYSLIFELSRSRQNRILNSDSEITRKIKTALKETPEMLPDFPSVACQGVEGAYSQIACERIFKNPSILYMKNFEAVFTAIEKGLCRYGVVPLENSTAGSVNKIYDLMMKHDFSIVRSVRIKVDHNLLALPGTKLSDIKEIYSHEQAINQCSEFLSSLDGIKVTACENTAEAAKRVAESGRNDVAAISSRSCAAVYALSTIEESIQDKGNNSTRFICISKKLEI